MRLFRGHLISFPASPLSEPSASFFSFMQIGSLIISSFALGTSTLLDLTKTPMKFKSAALLPIFAQVEIKWYRKWWFRRHFGWGLFYLLRCPLSIEKAVRWILHFSNIINKTILITLCQTEKYLEGGGWSVNDSPFQEGQILNQLYF